MASDFPAWHFAGVDTDDKNGGPNNLRAWRMHRGLSQAELAERVGTTPNMVQYLESGERGLSLKWLRRLADALETTPGHLADYNPNDVPDPDIFDFWSKRLDADQRRQLVRIAEALTQTGTDNK